ncbi:MAG: vWA domain-containing protein, partial [Blastocatellia bacterium]
MLKRISVFVLPLFFIFGALAFLQPANTPPGFTGLDVIILVDQSGSMWGAPGQRCGQQPCATRNDKFNHRIGQTKNVIYRLAEHVEDTPFVHRVSVIDFGGDAEIALSNHVIRFDPNNPGGALRDAKAVIERVVTHKDGVKGINTNTPRAMELALGEYRKMASSPPTAGRQSVMLIVTDGSPNNPPTPDAALQSSVVALADDLKKMNVGVWVVGLNDASNYWNDGDGQFWKGVVGQNRARLAETASSKIFTLVQDIVDEWLGGRSNLITGDEYQCPPYLRRVVFNVNFGSPSAPIRITNPDGVDIPLASGGPTTNPATFSRFIADDPKPGVYKLVKDPSRSYTISAEEYSPDIKRLSPIRAVSHEVEARIVFQANTSQGTPIAPLSAWPINASIMITPPGGTATKIPAQFIDDGKWEAKWKPPQVGTYTVRLEGIVTLQNGSPYDVFGANAKSYNDKLEVNNLKPYFLKLDDPDPEDGFRVTPMTTSADVSFILVDSKNVEVTNPAGVVNDPATWLSLQLVDKFGAPLRMAAIPLKLGSNGVFEASVPINVDWTKGWWDAGQLYFKVVDQPNRVGGQNYLDSIQLPPEAESQRVGGDPMTVGPLKIRYSRLLLAPLLLLVIGLIGAGAWYAWRVVLPGLWIWWADSSRNRTVTLKLYDGDRDPDGEEAIKLRISRRYRFKFDRKVSVEVDGETILAERFRVKRHPSPDVRVVVEYSWRNDPKKQVHRTTVSGPRPERLKG